jgi:DNA-dependent RNA polymerase auxiliary subunit epsilon
MHAKMAPSPSTGGIAGVQKSKTTKDEVNHQLLWSYGVACTNWAHDDSLRLLMDSKYHRVQWANDLLAQLLNKDLKDNVFNAEYIKTVSDAVSDVKSEIAPLFIREVVNNYIGPPSGQSDLEEYDSEYVSNFNLRMRQSNMAAYAAENKDFQKKLENASSDEEKEQLQYTMKYSFTKHHLPLLCWFGQFDTLGAWLGCNVTDASSNRKASTGRKQGFVCSIR